MNDNFGLGYAMGADSAENKGMGFGGDGAWLIWIILIFAILGGGFGGMGFGGFGGFGGGAGLQGIATRADINEGFALNNITSGIQALQPGQGDSTYAITGAISDLKYTVATENCATRNLMQTNTRDIIEAGNANTRAILDFMTQDKITTLQAENQALKFAASQSAQNAFIVANQDAQTAELIRRLGRDNPVPAYVVPNPNSYYGNPVGVGFGYAYGGANGCGCGGCC